MQKVEFKRMKKLKDKQHINANPTHHRNMYGAILLLFLAYLLIDTSLPGSHIMKVVNWLKRHKSLIVRYFKIHPRTKIRYKCKDTQ